MSDSFVGIDLGTSYSLVSVFQNGQAVLVKNSLGSFMTPSVISLDENDHVLIGEIAKDRLISHPDRTVAQFKRLMGTEERVQLGSKYFRPEELSSLILKSLKHDVEEFLGEEVQNVIISVPAYFNDKQRKATKLAGELAGLNVERIINEPTAAAIAYGLPNSAEELTFVVLDLGGGTFDVSILEIFDDTIEVCASAGDSFLGGNDFTEVILDYLLTLIGIPRSELSDKELQHLLRISEQMKQQLSLEPIATAEINFRESTLTLEMTESEFQTFAGELLERLRAPIERALADARISVNDLDEIVLVGGATRMPIIRKLVLKMFGKAPLTHVDPDKSIAMGAAIQSALKGRDQDLKDIVMTDVCPFTLGINVVRQTSETEFKDGHFLPIIERNSTIPISRMDTVATIKDNQEKLKVEIYQGESRLVENNIFLEKMEIKIPRDKAGNQLIDVRFTYDVNGILEVEAFSHGTGKTSRTIIEENPGSLSKDEIESMFAKLQHLKIHPREDIENRALIALGERLYQESRGDKREYIASCLIHFEKAVDSQDRKIIDAKRAEIQEIFNSLENHGGLL